MPDLSPTVNKLFSGTAFANISMELTANLLSGLPESALQTVKKSMLIDPDDELTPLEIKQLKEAANGSTDLEQMIGKYRNL